MTIERALINDALSWKLSKGLAQPAYEMGPNPNITQLIALAECHRVLPHLFMYLKETDRLKEHSSLLLREISLHQRKSLKNVALLIEVALLFEKHGIQNVPFKGPALSQRLYGEPTFRMCSDIDIFIAPTAFHQARLLLESVGFKHRVAHISGTSFEESLRYKKDLTLVHPDGTRVLELHFKLLALPFLQGMNWDTVWQNRCAIQVGGHNLSSMSDEDYLAYLCAHGHVHGWERLHWLFDFAYLYSRAFSHQKSKAVEVAEKHSLTHEMESALLLSHEAFGLELDEKSNILQKRNSRSHVKIKSAVASFQASKEANQVVSQLRKLTFWWPSSLRKKWDLLLFFSRLWHHEWVLSGKPLRRYELWFFPRTVEFLLKSLRRPRSL